MNRLETENCPQSSLQQFVCHGIHEPSTTQHFLRPRHLFAVHIENILSRHPHKAPVPLLKSERMGHNSVIVSQSGDRHWPSDCLRFVDRFQQNLAFYHLMVVMEQKHRSFASKPMCMNDLSKLVCAVFVRFDVAESLPHERHVLPEFSVVVVLKVNEAECVRLVE